MAQKYVNFRKLEVSGVTKEEALASAPFSVIMKDATQAYKKARAKKSSWSENDLKEFCMAYTEAQSKNAPGVGFSITLESAVSDTRERPYKFTDIKNEDGKRKYKKYYVCYDVETGMEVCRVDTTKADAKAALKELYATGDYRGHAKCVLEKKVTEGQEVVFEAEYAPSKGSRPGRYLVFGVAND